jgi:hypothetical protein
MNVFIHTTWSDIATKLTSLGLLQGSNLNVDIVYLLNFFYKLEGIIALAGTT